MHILLIPSWYSHLRSAGGGSFFRDQAQALAAAGHKVGLIYPKLWGLRDYRAGPLPAIDRIRTEDDGQLRVWRMDTLHRLPRVPFRDACKFAAAGTKLFDAYVAAEGQPDILHAHAALYGGVLAKRLSARRGVPFVLTEHSTDFAQGKHRWWQKCLVSGVLAAAAARLAVSPQLRDILLDQYAAQADPTTVVPNILTPAFEEAAPEDKVPGGPFVFLCAARISAEKNQKGLIRAFAQAFPAGGAGPDAELHFVGSGDGGPLVRLAEQLGIGGRVKVAGVLPAADVRRAMAAADAVVLPSFVETFGVVVIEALSQGAPVVATICGGPEGILTPDSGILVPPGDDPAMARALRDMHGRAASFDRAKLRRDCLETYGHKAVVRQLENIYARVLGKDDAGDGTA
ncbi:MAG TPA: glycosyltransferase family 4 protein [Rhodospirillaceae bacterium]|nr:glycosyltransferase family 4 protein [Rhodospirillaceae bacterium]